MKAKLEQEARRAAYKAEEEARFLQMRTEASEGSTEVMNDWLSRNKGLFENRKT